MKYPITPNWHIRPTAIRLFRECFLDSDIIGSKSLAATDANVFVPAGGAGNSWIYGGQGGQYTTGGSASKSFEGGGWKGGKTQTSSGTNTVRSDIDQINFSTSFLSLTGRSLTGTRYTTATSGHKDAGFIYGGTASSTSPVALSNIEKHDYTTRVLADSGRALVNARMSPGVVGTSAKGFIGGGQATSRFSTIENVDYSTYAAALTGKSLTAIRSLIATAGNKTTAMFCGGQGGYIMSTVDNFTYSTLTIAATANMVACAGGAATSSVSTVYIYGGLSGTGNAVSAIAQIDYSTKTPSVTGKYLSKARQNPAASGNEDNGWIYGGYSFGGAYVWFDTVDRYNYSSSASMITPTLSTTRNAASASGNKTPGEQP